MTLEDLSSAPFLSVLEMREMAPPLVGFFVVMAALVAIWLLLEVQGRFFQRLAKNGQAVAQMEMPEQGDLHGGVSPEMVAVITAAVHASLEGPARIVSISRGSDTAWSSEGRRSIYSSHRIR